MPRQVFLHDPPDRFVAGTVGSPGERVFYLQARTGARITSVALEKQQVAVLAERLEELLDEVVRRTSGTAPVPALLTAAQDDLAPLDQPVVEEFRVGTMALAYDVDDAVVVLEAQAPDDDDDEDGGRVVFGDEDESEGSDVLRVRLTGAQARAFVSRAQRVVAAGRPDCPFCQQPLEPSGHVCPRANGYRRALPS